MSTPVYIYWLKVSSTLVLAIALFIEFRTPVTFSVYLMKQGIFPLHYSVLVNGIAGLICAFVCLVFVARVVCLSYSLVRRLRFRRFKGLLDTYLLNVTDFCVLHIKHCMGCINSHLQLWMQHSSWIRTWRTHAAGNGQGSIWIRCLEGFPILCTSLSLIRRV